MAFFGTPLHCLDDEFDALDTEADHDLCCAIMAGRFGLHPDAWGLHNSLTAIMPVGYRKYEWSPFEPKPKPVHLPIDPAWVARHRRRPVEEPPRQPTIGWKELPVGRVQLTCDVCHRARFHITLDYRGDRPRKVADIRLMGRTAGWTCIAGTDRCPACSEAAPKPVGNGAGGNQGDEQHG